VGRGFGAGSASFAAGFGGAGVGTGTGFGAASGISRPPIGVIPPARGPGAPARLIVITVVGVSSAVMPQLNGPKTINATMPTWAAIDQRSTEPSGSVSRCRATITSVTSLTVLRAASK
jgi:hypothetical protein